MRGVLRLEELCLSHIVDYFSIFNYAYASSENEFLQRGLLFLQRAYSPFLIKHLCERRLLRADYLKFVINKYVKELDCTLHFDPFWKELIERVIEIAENLVKISFETDMLLDYPEKTKEIISLLKNVEHVYVPYAKNEIVKLISRSCPNLKVLDLRDTICIGDEAIKSLCGDGFESVGIHSLRVLHLDSAKINVETTAFILTNMPSLEIFSHYYVASALYSLHRNDLIEDKLHTIKKYSLTELYVKRFNLSRLVDFLTICTVVCPDIRKLACPVDTQDQLDLCCKFPKLEDLTLHNPNLRSLVHLDEFLKAKGNNLISLDIENFSVSTSVLIQNCQRLEKLHLTNINFYYTKCARIPILRHLKELRIYSYLWYLISLADLNMILECSPNLEDFCVLHTKYTSELEDVISQFSIQNVTLL